MSSAPGGDKEIGTRLQGLRKLHGLSQRELARRSGVTNGTISLIEQGQVSPSVASLKKILAAFPLTLAEFFALDLDGAAQIFYRADQLTVLSSGPLSFRQVGQGTGGRKLQLLHELYQPGADTGAEMLAHAGEEAGIVVGGEVEITVGGQTATLRKGDGYYFDSRRPHRFRNLGAEPCEIVSAGTPPTF